MAVVIKRFDIFIVRLDPTQGSEIKKTRPCVVISPDEINNNINTIIIAPLTSSSKKYPTRVEIIFQTKKGLIVLDQIRTIDKKRLIKKIGKLNKKKSAQVISVLQELFAM